MLDHYLEVGGNEIVNSARAYAYARTAGCPVGWLKDPLCGTIADVQGDPTYDYANIAAAPWYDPDEPEITSGFLGLYGIEIAGLSDATVSATVTEKTVDGAVVSGYRHSSREVRVRAWLTATSEISLEAGMTWLRNALEPDACGQHSTTCGVTDAEFFVDCPPVRNDVWFPGSDGGYGEGDYGEGDYGEGPDPVPAGMILEPDNEYRARVDVYRRFIHGVTLVSGPFVMREAVTSDHRVYGRLVEFTLVAGVPWIYGKEKPLQIPPLVPTVVDDIAYNLVLQPSMELDDGTDVIVATNYTTNPSLETNDAGWRGNVGAPISLSDITATRVVGELSSVGPASWRVQFTAPGSGSGGYFCARQVPIVSVFPTVDGTRVSITMWAATVVMAGAPVVNELRFVAFWYDAATSELAQTDLGTVDVAGGAISVKSLVPPVGADRVVVEARAVMGAYASGDVVRLYSDAVAVTVP